MKLYQNIHLDCTQVIQEYVRNYNKWSKYNTQYLELPETILSLLDAELNSKGLPNSWCSVAFRRFNSPLDANTCHIDSSWYHTHKLSVIIPISGCKDTYQYWYGGKFHVENKITPSNVTYEHIVWDDEPILLDTIEIYENPIVSRADIPHSVYSNNNEHRITYTFRFPKEITFDEVCEKLC